MLSFQNSKFQIAPKIQTSQKFHKMAVKPIPLIFAALTAVFAVAVTGAPQSNQMAAQWAGAAASGNGPVGKVHIMN